MEALAGLIFWVIFLILMSVVWWKIVKRTGYHGALGLLLLVPIVNIVFMLILAFKEWPIQRELRALKTGGAASSKPMSPALIAVLIIAGSLPLLMIIAAIAIPSLLNTKLSANEAYARANIQTVLTAIESYNADKGQYPASEYDLKEGNYLVDYFDNIAKNGYTYSLSFSPEGYRISAAPEVCAKTGKKIITATNTDGVTEQDCR